MSALFCMILLLSDSSGWAGFTFRLRSGVLDSASRCRGARSLEPNMAAWLGGGWGRVCIHVHTLAEVSTQTLSVLFTFS